MNFLRSTAYRILISCQRSTETRLADSRCYRQAFVVFGLIVSQLQSNYLLKTLSCSSAVGRVEKEGSFAAFGFMRWLVGAANVPDGEGMRA